MFTHISAHKCGSMRMVLCQSEDHHWIDVYVDDDELLTLHLDSDPKKRAAFLRAAKAFNAAMKEVTPVVQMVNEEAFASHTAKAIDAILDTGNKHEPRTHAPSMGVMEAERSDAVSNLAQILGGPERTHPDDERPGAGPS